MIVGIDYSVTCPSICLLGPTFQETKFHFLIDKKKLNATFDNVTGWFHSDYKTTEERFANITNWAIDRLPDPCIVYIEDYSMGSKGQTFSIGENTGLLKHYLYCNKVKFHLFSPGAIKKDFTGKGNATKDIMYDAFVEKTQIDLFVQLHLNRLAKVGSPISDIVDSYAIALFGKKQCNDDVVRPT